MLKNCMQMQKEPVSRKDAKTYFIVIRKGANLWDVSNGFSMQFCSQDLIFVISGWKFMGFLFALELFKYWAETFEMEKMVFIPR